MVKPDIKLDTEEYTYEESKPKGKYVAPERMGGNSNVGNCCELAKGAWLKVVKDMETQVNNQRSNDISGVLEPSSLDCRNFYNMIKELRLMKPGSFAPQSVNKIVGRYFRIDQLKTSLLSPVATIAKAAGAEALEVWQYCASKKTEEPDSSWQNQLRRDMR